MMGKKILKRERQQREKAGVLVNRYNNGDEPLVLVESARKLQNQLVFPVGSVKKGESFKEAAKRECEEESGYMVEIGCSLPPVQFEDDKIINRFTFFMATVVPVHGFRSGRRRHRTWYSGKGINSGLDAIATIDVICSAIFRAGPLKAAMAPFSSRKLCKFIYQVSPTEAIS